MWTDIDYMDRRRVFSVDPERFPLHRMRQLVDKLHKDHQQYIVMVDPAVAAADYGAYNRGVEKGVFMKEQDGSLHLGVVWPGVTVYPDWFNPATQSYWTEEFQRFFNKDTGVDIDGVWIDMNEPANFCDYPCEDPEQAAIDQNMPPKPPAVRPDPVPALEGFPNTGVKKREAIPGNLSHLPIMRIC
jgi:alpha-glucosidase